jgi:hypothetical protein
VRESSRIKVYNALAVPIFLNGRKKCIIRQKGYDEIFQKNSRIGTF